MKKIGIYCIKSKIDNKVYVGKSISIPQRISSHFQKLKTNKHANRHLQSAYNLYGRNNFSYEILEICDASVLFDKEAEYIIKTKSLDDNFGYNMKIEFSGFNKHSKDSIIYMRSLRKCKTVFGFSIEGEFIKEWESISYCAKELEVNPCDVRRTISQKQRTCKGYVLNNEKVFRLRKNKRKDNVVNFYK